MEESKPEDKIERILEIEHEKEKNNIVNNPKEIEDAVEI
jgi:hypothetical protein